MIDYKYLIILAASSLIYVSIFTSDGQLDSSFGSSGVKLTQVSRQDVLTALQIQPNDDIVVVGSTLMRYPELFLARYAANGILDSTFNSGGSMPGTQTLLIGMDTEGQDVVLQPSDNKIVVAGFVYQSSTNMFVARYNTDGSIDTTFNTVGYATLSIGDGAAAYAVAMQSTGDIIIAGTSISNGTPEFALARYTSAGALDTASFGTAGITTTQIGTTSFIEAIAIIPSGYYQDYIIVMGTSDEQITIARYTPNGALDTSFGSSGIFMPNTGAPAVAYDMILDQSNNILIAGSIFVADDVSDSLLIRCTESGTLDNTFNGTGYVTTQIDFSSEYYSLTLQIDDFSYNNYILAVGYSSGDLSYNANIARYTTAGTLDPAYGTGGFTSTSVGSYATAQTVGIQSTGKAVAAGQSDSTFLLSRYTG